MKFEGLPAASLKQHGDDDDPERIRQTIIAVVESTVPVDKREAIEAIEGLRVTVLDCYVGDGGVSVREIPQ